MKKKGLRNLFQSALIASKPAVSTPTLHSSLVESLVLSPPDSNSEPSEEPRKKNSTGNLAREVSDICSLVCGASDSESLNPSTPSFEEGTLLGNLLDIPWVSNRSETRIAQRRKELSRERKHKWVNRNTQTHRFQRLVRVTAEKLGTEATLDVFGKLGREAGAKEHSALICLCIKKARESNDEDSLDQFDTALQLFKSMREQGFKVDEETYGPLLMYLVDMGMEEEFLSICKLLKDDNSGTCFRLGYYEMLLWIKLNNEPKIHELCKSVGVDSDDQGVNLAENYLLALCENDRKTEILGLLNVVDITRISSLKCVDSIFHSLGRFSMEEFAEKLILTFRASGSGEGNISSFIYDYTVGMPNLEVEEAILRFHNLHEKLEVIPSSPSYEKLIIYCCNSLKVDVGLDLVEQMCQMGLTVSVGTVSLILHACEQCHAFELVHKIYSVIRHHNLKPKEDALKCMINLYMKMKDFEGANTILTYMEEINIAPTSNIYNSIMAGYFREKNTHRALVVLREMKLADVKPDSLTFSYLLNNCECEEDIVKYLKEMKRSEVPATKHVHMSLINAYAKCGQLDKAKQVVLDQGISIKNLNEIRSVLVSALASNGKILDALEVYEEIKEAGGLLEPKAIISLIEYFHDEGDVNKLLQLLGELTDTCHWYDGCGRIVLYCIRHKHLSCVIDLLKQMKEKDKSLLDICCDQMFGKIWETEPVNLEIGMDLLHAIKEELQISPSRTSLDFLLSTCLSAKDPKRACLIWKEYQRAGLHFNVLTYLRMYQVLLAGGNHKSAKEMLKKISTDDPHVREIIKLSQITYASSKPVNKKKRK